MIYEYLVTENKTAFLAKVQSICAKLGINPDWLMFVMKTESGLNSRAVNRTSGATGLIQFMPTTAASLGTTTGALAAMSNVEQLDYVYKYFKPYAGRIHSAGDCYAVVFFPAMIGKPDNYVLQTGSLSAALIARQNHIFDLDKNQQITAGEFRRYVLNKFPSPLMEAVKKK